MSSKSMFDPYRVCAAIIEIVEDRYDLEIKWTITRKSDGKVITGPGQCYDEGPLVLEEAATPET